MKERMSLVDGKVEMSVRQQSTLLGINRSSLYYKPVGENQENLKLMEVMDKLFLEDPTLGVLGMQDELLEYALDYNEKRIRRLLRKMGVEPIYPKKNLSKLGQAKYVNPYLLRGLEITRANQVWAIDISYVPMPKGFMYLTAIIDIYSRYIVGWQVSNSLEKETQTELLKATVQRYGAPEIINSDPSAAIGLPKARQGSQYTCEHWVETVKTLGIKVSMDGKGRATDNAFIERFFRTIKQKHIYLNPADNGLKLYQGISSFITKYNNRKHQGINRNKPIERHALAA